jgi:hypothetical protein
VKTKNPRYADWRIETNLWKLEEVGLKIEHDKCVFGVPSGQLLGFLSAIEKSRQAPRNSSHNRDGSSTQH